MPSTMRHSAYNSVAMQHWLSSSHNGLKCHSGKEGALTMHKLQHNRAIQVRDTSRVCQKQGLCTSEIVSGSVLISCERPPAGGCQNRYRCILQ
eukprot:3713502-Amphidinium_carterae.1